MYDKRKWILLQDYLTSRSERYGSLLLKLKNIEKDNPANFKWCVEILYIMVESCPTEESEMGFLTSNVLLTKILVDKIF